MKKLFFTIIISIFLTYVMFYQWRSNIIAATPTLIEISSPSATTIIDKLKKIEILKEKIATRVAEIREKEKAAISGAIKTITDRAIILAVRKGEQNISYSEDTIFYKLSDDSKGDPLEDISIKKITTGDKIAVFGYSDKTGSLLSAKYIYLFTAPIHLLGKIADIDKTSFTIIVKELQGNTLADIETSTKISSFNKKGGVTKIGFSKLKIGDSVHLYANPNLKEENRVTALRILALNFVTPPTATPTASLDKVSTPSATPIVTN